MTLDVLTFLLARVVDLDPVSRTYNMLGAFERLPLREFPSRPQAFYCFAELTGWRGDLALTLRVVDADEERPPVLTNDARVNLPSPLHTAHVVFAVKRVAFPSPGHYRAQFFAGNRLLRERRLFVE